MPVIGVVPVVGVGVVDGGGALGVGVVDGGGCTWCWCC